MMPFLSRCVVLTGPDMTGSTGMTFTMSSGNPVAHAERPRNAHAGSETNATSKR